MLDFLEQLNAPQLEAVKTTEGPLLVLAGAGSGKTKMLTSRIAYLMLEKRVRPSQILSVTFTNKAAQEMRLRIAKALPDGVGIPYDIGTFHAICAKILRREAAFLPFTKPFVIYDDSDQLSLLKSVVKKLGIDDKAYSPKSFMWAINRLKCDAEEPLEVHPGARGIERKLPEVYAEYQRQLFENNALDFGEMITLTYRLLRDHPEVRARVQSRYKYILVDEYQDTNRAQYFLISMIASLSHGGSGNLCVVGDEDQSIYGWRGADIRNILDFERDFPGASLVKLEQNYRSTQTIVAASSDLIAHNTQRKRKRLWTDSEEGTPIMRVQCPDDRSEAAFVVAEIKRLIEDNPEYSLSDFAIFYRTHAQSRLVEENLTNEKIPYRIVGGLRFFDRKEIKDLMCYLRLVLNPSDSVSLKRVINTPVRGIGKTTIDKLESAWNQQGSLWDFLVEEAIQPQVFSGRTLKKLQDFRTMVDGWIQEQGRIPVSELYHRILAETRYVEELKSEGTDEAIDRIDNLEELDSMIAEFEERDLDQGTALAAGDTFQEGTTPLSRFLEQNTLSDVPELEGQMAAVQMMTFHGCKGLEFPVVFMVGMEEGLFPSVRRGEMNDDIELEEERRLCYVGMTRARERLYLLHAQLRRVWGDLLYQYPARFFDEIPEKYVETRTLEQSLARSLSRY